jgi:hypothetical protein
MSSTTLVLLLEIELTWIQVEETFSEDPYLAGEIGYQYVTGVQSLNVSAMVKHFAGFSMPEQGLNTGPVQGGERHLRTTCVNSSLVRWGFLLTYDLVGSRLLNGRSSMAVFGVS